MPTPAESVYKYRRLSHTDYAIWYGGKLGLLATESAEAAVKRSRRLIEEELIAMAQAVETDVIEDTESENPAGDDAGLDDTDVGEADAPVPVEEIPNSEDFPAELSYDAMTLAELKEECRARGLPISGTKAELALRLKRDDEGITESAPTPEAPDEESAAEEEVDAPDEESAATEVEIDAKITEQEPTTETDE